MLSSLFVSFLLFGSAWARPVVRNIRSTHGTSWWRPLVVGIALVLSLTQLFTEFERLLEKHATETGLPVVVDFYSVSVEQQH